MVREKWYKENMPHQRHKTKEEGFGSRDKSNTTSRTEGLRSQAYVDCVHKAYFSITAHNLQVCRGATCCIGLAMA